MAGARVDSGHSGVGSLLLPTQPQGHPSTNNKHLEGFTSRALVKEFSADEKGTFLVGENSVVEQASARESAGVLHLVYIPYTYK